MTNQPSSKNGQARLRLAIVAAAALVLALAAPSGAILVPPPPTVPPISISLLPVDTLAVNNIHTTDTIVQGTSTTLHWQIYVPNAENLPVDWQYSSQGVTTDVDGENGGCEAELVGKGNVNSQGKAKTSVVNVMAPRAPYEMMFYTDDGNTLWPVQYQSLDPSNLLGLDYFYDVYVKVTTAIDDSEVPQAFDCTVSLGVIGADPLLRTGDEVLKGVVTAVPLNEYDLLFADCTIVENTYGACTAVVPAAVQVVGDNANPIPLAGYGDHGELSASAKISFALKGDVLTQEFYAMDGAHEGSCGNSDGPNVRNHGHHDTSYAVEINIPDGEKREACFGTAIWEDDPGDRNDDWWADDDDLIDGYVFSLWYSYKDLSQNNHLITGLSAPCEDFLEILAPGGKSATLGPLLECLASDSEAKATSMDSDGAIRQFTAWVNVDGQPALFSEDLPFTVSAQQVLRLLSDPLSGLSTN